MSDLPPNAVRMERPSLCPYCGNYQDGATPILNEKAVPKPGDGSLCIVCGGICEFDIFLTLKKVDADKLAYWKLVEPKSYEFLVRGRILIQRRNAFNPAKPYVPGTKQ